MRSSLPWTFLVLLFGMAFSISSAQNILGIQAVKISTAPTLMNTTSADFKRNWAGNDLLLDNTAQFGMGLAAEIWWANRLFGEVFLKYFLPIKYENDIALNTGMRGLGIGYDLLAAEDWELIATLSFANQIFRLKNTSELDRFDTYGFQIGLSGLKKVWHQKTSLGIGLGYSRNVTPINYKLFIDQPDLAKGSVFNNFIVELVASFDLLSKGNVD